MHDRLHILGIRHHGPGSAALLQRALEALDPACVLIEGPPEADPLIRYAGAVQMKPPVALLIHASADTNAAIFIPFAEFSPEWQAMRWALKHDRRVRFIDGPAGISIHRLLKEKEKAAEKKEAEPGAELATDPLDALADAAGFLDGEEFWNSLIEQGRLRRADFGSAGTQVLAIFSAIESAMTAVRAGAGQAQSEESQMREAQREAWMRIHIRQALKECEGTIAAVVGAWHTSALRSLASAAADKEMVKDLAREKVEATWVPWTDSRLAAASGYGAGVISPGWYMHLWNLYRNDEATGAEEFAAQWQARTAALLRKEGYAASTAAAIEAARLSLALAAMRARPVAGMEEMREGALATWCHGDEAQLRIIERKLYVGERVGEIDPAVPQMPLARDLALWQKRTRLKPEDVEAELRVDLRSEAGLLKSTLLHRLAILNVPWGKLIEADSGRGTFRETWRLHWIPELSVALAEALVYGGMIEQAAANSQLQRAANSSSIAELAEMIRAALIADLPDAATACIARLQAAAVQASEITELMQAVVPLARVPRYGTARKLPEEPLRALIYALSVEVNAGIRLGSHNLDQDTAAERVRAMRAFDEALHLVGDSALLESWQDRLEQMVEDGQVVPEVAGLSLRRLHDLKAWELFQVSAAFSRHTLGETPQRAGAFLECFLGGGSEVLLQDVALLDLIDEWLCGLREEEFVESLPLVRRSFSSFDAVARRRLLEQIAHGPRTASGLHQPHADSDDGFAHALPLLYCILGIEADGGGAA
ncbi:MAG: DUF5682 family protein [Terracidiphilus sp.]